MTGDDIGRIVRLAELDVLERGFLATPLSAKRRSALEGIDDERRELEGGLSDRGLVLNRYATARLEQGRAEKLAIAIGLDAALTSVELRACALVVARQLLEEPT